MADAVERGGVTPGEAPAGRGLAVALWFGADASRGTAVCLRGTSPAGSLDAAVAGWVGIESVGRGPWPALLILRAVKDEGAPDCWTGFDEEEGGAIGALLAFLGREGERQGEPEGQSEGAEVGRDRARA